MSGVTERDLSSLQRLPRQKGGRSGGGKGGKLTVGGKLTAREAADNDQPEWEFQRQIVQYLELRGWKVFHNADSRRTQAGVLDLMCVRPPDLVFIEVKSTKGRLTREQQVHLADLKQVKNVRSDVMYPQDWERMAEEMR